MAMKNLDLTSLDVCLLFFSVDAEDEVSSPLSPKHAER